MDGPVSDSVLAAIDGHVPGDEAAVGSVQDGDDDRWMWEFIHTEAKPRKNISRKKSKARRKQQRLKWENTIGDIDTDYIQNLIDIGLNPFNDPCLRLPGTYDRPVPTLNDLCVQVLYKYSPSQLKCLPYRIRRKIGAAGHPMQNQQHACLAIYFDYLEALEFHLLEVEHRNKCNYYAPQMQRLQLGKRCIANSSDRSASQRLQFNPLIFEKCDNILSAQIQPKLYNLQGYDKMKYCDHYAKVAGFAGYLNCLIPSFTRDSKKAKKKDASLDEYEKECVKMAVNRVHQQLKTRIPFLCENFFQVMLPFVWWSRGDRLFSEEYFKLAISTAKSDEVAALLYNELGRMYVHFGDVHFAPQCFLKAADISKQCQSEEIQALIGLQANMLIASAFDQGVMNDNRGHHAMLAWNVALKDADSFSVAEYSAFVSLMCYHLAHTLTMERSKVLELARKYPLHFYGLSLVEAMAGNEPLATDYYQLFVTGFAARFPDLYHGSYPGTGDVITHNGQIPVDYHPWMKITMTVGEGFTLRPLPILWRTSLTHPIFKHDFHGTGVCDISPGFASLWMTPDGFVSGDFHLLLPPVPQVKLDPYTGALAYIQGSIPPGPWKSRDLPTLNIYQANEFHMPMQTRVYEHKNGVTVDLYMAFHATKPDCAMATAAVLLTWRSHEQEVIVDLKKEIKLTMRKSLIQQVQTYKDFSKSYNVEEYLKSVERCYQKEYSLQFEHVLSQSVRASEIKLMAERSPSVVNADSGPTRKKEMKKELKRLRKCEVRKHHERFYICLQSYTTVGSSVVLLLGPSESASKGSFMLVFDCSSSENFKDWKMEDLGEFRDDHGLSSVTAPFDHIHYPNASVYMLRRRDLPHPKRQHMQKTLKWFNIYDTRGNLLACRMADEKHDSPERIYLDMHCVIGHTLYGINYSTNRVVGDNVLLDMCIQSRRINPASLDSLGKWLLVTAGFGVYVMNAQLETLKWNFIGDEFSLELADGGRRLQGEDFMYVHILWNEELNEGQCHRVIIGFQDIMILFYLFDGKPWDEALQCTAVVQVPGRVKSVKEACFIDEKHGFIVVASMSDTSDEFYQENVYQYTTQGRMIGVLPFLGFGPHKFLPVDLPGNEDAAISHDNPLLAKPGVFIYCKDGYGGICCFKPVEDHSTDPHRSQKTVGPMMEVHHGN